MQNVNNSCLTLMLSSNVSSMDPCAGPPDDDRPHPGWPVTTTEYLVQLERCPDGSLRTILYRDGRPIRQETVRSLRHGRRRAYDLLCTAIDTTPDPANPPAARGTRSPTQLAVRVPQTLTRLGAAAVTADRAVRHLAPGHHRPHGHPANPTT